MNDVVVLLNDLDDPLRMLCIDMVFQGGVNFLKGFEVSGRKQILTALRAAEIEPVYVDVILDDLPACLALLPKHRELDALR